MYGGMDMDSPRTKPLTWVRVASANLSFGCMVGHVEGGEFNGQMVTVSLVSHRRQRLLGGWPRVGDLVGCEWMRHSIFLAHVLLHKEDVIATCFLRRCLPADLTEEYLPIRRPLIRVDGY